MNTEKISSICVKELSPYGEPINPHDKDSVFETVCYYPVKILKSRSGNVC